jgi:hypothetical protein
MGIVMNRVPRRWLPVAGMAALALVAGTLSFAQAPGNKQTTFFMGRIKYSKNNGNDCAGVGKNMARLVSQVSTIAIEDERTLALTDPALFETPFVFMNGHDDFVFSDAELASLRVYLNHGGFLFVSGCCTNPGFPKAWRREMARLFPGEATRHLPYEHPVYKAFYRIDRVRSLHQNRDVQLEALFFQDRIVSVMCEDGLCCAFSMDNRCNVGRGVSPEDGKRLALNLAVYAMTH